MLIHHAVKNASRKMDEGRVSKSFDNKSGSTFLNCLQFVIASCVMTKYS